MNCVASDDIEIIHASENNLKKISVVIPKGNLVLLAGVSGSGKSSLAFGTIAVESNRQWQASYPMYLLYARHAENHEILPRIIEDIA